MNIRLFILVLALSLCVLPHARVTAAKPLPVVRLALLPISAPDSHRDTAKQLSRALERALKEEVDLVVLTAGVMGEPLETCLVNPVCMDRVLRTSKAEAVLVGQVILEPERGSASPRLLLSLLAPDWPVMYVERFTDLEAEGIGRTAKALVTLAWGERGPTRRATLEPAGESRQGAGAGSRSDRETGDADWLKQASRDRDDDDAPRPAKRSGRAAEDEAVARADTQSRQPDDEKEAVPLATKPSRRAVEPVEGREEGIDPDDDALAETPASSKSPRKDREDKKSRQKNDLKAERLPGETPKKATKARASKAKKAARSWPARAPEGKWHGWAIELQAAGAYGALLESAASQVAVATTGQVSGSYRWAIREDAAGLDVRLSVGRAIGRRLELALEGGVLTAPQQILAVYYPEGQPSFQALITSSSLHILGGARLRWFLSTSAFQPYVGLGVSGWLIPAMSVTEPLAGPHEPFGSYVRIGLEPAFGLRALLSPRLYLGVEARGLIDPGDPLLQRSDGAYGAIPIGELIAVPAASRAVLSLRLGLGVLW